MQIMKEFGVSFKTTKCSCTPKKFHKFYHR